jgi:DNA-binding NarL/FixJ family response regulator
LDKARFDGGCLFATVLMVEDFQPFRQLLSSILQRSPRTRLICEVADGLQAVEKADELDPDLILLDIGLPKLNGIEAARRISQVSPQSKIIFVSSEFSAEIMRNALATGARGYVVKVDAGRELLTAVEAVLRGEEFLSSTAACVLCEYGNS